MEDYRNLYLPDGTWAGQFMDQSTAEKWAKQQGYNLTECEISTRRVPREPRVENILSDDTYDGEE